MPILDLFDIDVAKLTSKTGTEDERAAVDRLVMLLNDAAAQSKLIVQLQNEAKEKQHDDFSSAMFARAPCRRQSSPQQK